MVVSRISEPSTVFMFFLKLEGLEQGEHRMSQYRGIGTSNVFFWIFVFGSTLDNCASLVQTCGCNKNHQPVTVFSICMNGGLDFQTIIHLFTIF